MDFIQAIILGLVQGLTEFLPISSSGHLVLIPELLNWPVQPLEFDAVIHLATLIAVLIYFRNELGKIFKAMTAKQSVDINYKKLGYIILIATIPAIILGGLMKLLPVNYFRQDKVIIITLIGWAIVMFIVDRFLKNIKKTHAVQSIGWRQGIIIGVFQALALIPGTSRSGVCITAGLIEGLDRPTAARFSFLLGIPAIALAGGISFMEILGNSFSDINLLALSLAFLCALASGYLAIKFLIKFLEKFGLDIFVIYRIILGITLILTIWQL